MAHGTTPYLPEPAAPGPAPTSNLLKEDLAQKLREEILLGRIAPGEKIIEARWGRQFGVAQTSIREALNILSSEGFVTKRHGRSARVLLLRETDIIHLYQVRGALEGLAARLITENRLPLDDLESALGEIGEAVRSNDVRRVVSRVQQFHLRLMEKPQNPFLFEQGRRLIIPLYAFTLMRALSKNLDASPWKDGLAHHQRIIDAMKMGSPMLAEQVVIHITRLFLESALNVWAH